MATADQIATAIATFCEHVTGMRTVTDPTTLPSPPCAVVLPAQGTFIDYTVALQTNVVDYTWRIVILVSRGHDRVQLPRLYQYISPAGANSIPAAIYADETLGGQVDYCVPVECTGPSDISWSGEQYLGAEIIITAGAE